MSITKADRVATLRRIAELVEDDSDGDLPCPDRITMEEYASGGGYVILELDRGDEDGVALWANLLDLGDPELGGRGGTRWFSARRHLITEDSAWLCWRTVEVVTYLGDRS